MDKNEGKIIPWKSPVKASEELQTKECKWAKEITCLEEDSCWDGCLHNPTNQCYKRCDAKRVMVRGEAPEMWWVRCQGCRVIGPCMKTPEEAREEWNRRDERIKERLAMKKELEARPSDTEQFHQNKCNSCGEPMSNDCPKCQRLWES